MVAGGGGGAGVKEAAAALRVLVVDDSPVDRRVVELLLRNHKGGAAASCFHVTAVDSGKKAMELLGQKPEVELGSSAPADADEQSIDMVLTDYCMPEMTGYDLLKAIKALRSPNPIPVVVMSSENEPQRIRRCLTAGAEDFILKPFKAKDVQRLRRCSGVVRPAAKDAAYGDDRRRCSSWSDNHAPAAAPEHAARKATPEQRPRKLAGLAMVLNASPSTTSTEVSHYLQLLFKLVVLAYAVLCLSELLHRAWSSNGRFFLSLW